jgi:hypothetical protein
VAVCRIQALAPASLTSINMIDPVAELRSQVDDFRGRFTLAKQEIGDAIPWYPYDSLSSLDVTAMLLYRDIVAMSGRGRILDLASRSNG